MVNVKKYNFLSQDVLRKKRVRLKLKQNELKMRISVFYSNKNMEVQLIDDPNHETVVGISTKGKSFKEQFGTGVNSKIVTELARLFVEACDSAGIKKDAGFVFDRGGRKYCGLLRVFAEYLRSAGFVF